MKSRYVCTRSANVGDIDSNKAQIRVIGYVILDSGKYSGFSYPDIRIPIEINSFIISDHSYYFSTYLDVTSRGGTSGLDL